MHCTSRPCLNCQIETQNPKFCSRSCSATYYNKLYPKRFMTHECITCHTKIRSRHKYCVNCRPYHMPLSSDKTIADIHIAAKYQVSSVIRNLARRVYYGSHKPKVCYVCGYNKHIHVCHIKPINSFDVNTQLGIVNNIDNLIGLCPNHHWELDHNQLVLPIKTIT